MRRPAVVVLVTVMALSGCGGGSRRTLSDAQACRELAAASSIYRASVGSPATNDPKNSAFKHLMSDMRSVAGRTKSAELAATISALVELGVADAEHHRPVGTSTAKQGHALALACAGA